MKQDNETNIAKLRNQLSPIYGIVDMLLHCEGNEQLLALTIQQARQALDNKDRIDELLILIEKDINRCCLFPSV